MPDGSLLLLGVCGPDLTVGEAECFSRLQPAGFVLDARNFCTAEGLRKLTDDLRGLSKVPPIIALGHHAGGMPGGGGVIPVIPSARAMAADGNIRAIGQTAACFAGALRLLGVNLLMGPVLDLDWFPDRAAGERCWGRDPQRVVDHAGGWNRFARKRGLAGCAGCFPAGGRAAATPDGGLPVCHADWRDLQREDGIPYTALMPELDAIMTGHALFSRIDPDFPASLSPKVVRRLLRDQLGFDRHLVLTDDLDADWMRGYRAGGDDVRMAIEAGNDLAVIPRRGAAAEDAARALRSVSSVVRADAAERVERFRWKTVQPPLVWSESNWRAACEALAAASAAFTPPAVE